MNEEKYTVSSKDYLFIPTVPPTFIPRKMSTNWFDLLLETLKLWKRNITK